MTDRVRMLVMAYSLEIDFSEKTVADQLDFGVSLTVT